MASNPRDDGDEETGFYQPSVVLSVADRDSSAHVHLPASSANHRVAVPESHAPASVRQAGPYQVALELASGGMAKVYLGLHDVAGLPVPVAVKQIHKHLATDQKFIDMFGDEARIVAGINHPYVCRVFDFGKADGSYYIAMEYLQGAPLSDVFHLLDDQRVSKIEHSRVMARILANLAEGLHAAHELRDANGVPMEVVHRDVTPQNLFVLSDGTVRVTDFGIARARVRVHRTIGANIKGKLAYLAPEQIEQQDVDRRADVWGLGVVAWELLTGRRLFHASSEGQTVLAVLRREIPKPSKFAPCVPPELDALVLRALTRNPAERFATARELSRALERFLAKSGPGISTLDVESWMADMFPDLIARTEALLARAHALANAHRHERDPDSPPSVTRQVASGPVISDKHYVPVEEVVSEREPSRSRWRQRLAGAALGVALVVLAWAVYGTRDAGLTVTAPQVADARPAARAPTPLPVAVQLPPVAALLPAERTAPSATTHRKNGAEAPKSAPSAAAERDTGSVQVDTKNGQATVYLGARALGTTPLTVDLPAGAQSLRLVPVSGGEPVAVSVNVERGAESFVTVTLVAP